MPDEISRSLHEIIVRYEQSGAVQAFRRQLEREVTPTQIAERELAVEATTITEALASLGEPDLLWPQRFQAVGNGVADDTEPMKACLAEARKRKQARVKITSRHVVSSSVWVGQPGDLEIVGLTPEAGFIEAPNYTGATTALAIDGPTGKGTPVAITKTFKAFEQPHALSVTGTAEFTIGGFAEIAIERDVLQTTAIQRGMLNRVTGKTGTVLQFEQPLPFGLDADDLAFAKVTPVALHSAKLVVRDLLFTGRNTTSETAFRVFHYIDPVISNIRTSNFQNAGPAIENWWGGAAIRITDIGSGHATTHSGQSLRANRLTGTLLDEWRSDQSKGMGVTHRQLAHCRVGRVLITNAHGRGYYLYGSSGNIIGFVLTDNSGSTGFSGVYGSSANKIIEAVSRNSDHQGFWLNGRKNQDNEVVTMFVEGSKIAPDVSTNASDTGNKFYFVDAGSVGVLPGTIITRGTAAALRARVAALVL